MVARKLAIRTIQPSKAVSLIIGDRTINPAQTGGIIFCLQDLLRDRIDWL